MVNKIDCRLQIDPPADGAWNMAVDEALLAEAHVSKHPTLRFYQWERPTLSLGYFQKYAERSHHTGSLKEDVVRRLSGGGAILHDQELTYSLILPASHPLAGNTQALYSAVHHVLVQILQSAIADAPNCNFESCTDLSDPDPFLCFQRRFEGDILLKTPDQKKHKIVGSAQRRRQGGVLQHGSILLAMSTVAPELPGIQELTGIQIQPETLSLALPTSLAKSLKLNLIPDELSHKLKNSALQIRLKKYLCDRWTNRR